MTGPRRKFIDSPYFVEEPGNWHLKPGAPPEIVREFWAFMRATALEPPDVPVIERGRKYLVIDEEALLDASLFSDPKEKLVYLFFHVLEECEGDTAYGVAEKACFCTRQELEHYVDSLELKGLIEKKRENNVTTIHANRIKRK